MKQPTSRQKKRKKNRILKYTLLTFLLLLISGGAYAGYMYVVASNTIDGSNEQLNRGDKSDMRNQAVQPLKDNVSLLIMGVDESETRKEEYGGATRTDALMYATFNITDKSVKLLSIPRDTYTYIPVEKKKDKINHAHAFGGVDGTVDAVENLLDVPVDYYLKVNFEAFIDIVDVLGGIEVDVPVTFTEQDSKDNPGAISLKKGLQTLDGEEALALARTRKIDSDAERGKRQMLVVEAIVKKAISPSSVFKADDLLTALGKNMKTNMTFTDIKSFYKYGLAMNNLKITPLQLVGEDGHINGIYYYIPDKEELNLSQNELKKHLGLSVTSHVDSGTKKDKQ